MVLVVKSPLTNAGDIRDSLGQEEEGMATHTVLLPGESHGQRSLLGYSPQDHTESDMTNYHFQFMLCVITRF